MKWGIVGAEHVMPAAVMDTFRAFSAERRTAITVALSEAKSRRRWIRF